MLKRHFRNIVLIFRLVVVTHQRLAFVSNGSHSTWNCGKKERLVRDAICPSFGPPEAELATRFARCCYRTAGAMIEVGMVEGGFIGVPVLPITSPHRRDGNPIGGPRREGIPDRPR